MKRSITVILFVVSVGPWTQGCSDSDSDNNGNDGNGTGADLDGDADGDGDGDADGDADGDGDTGSGQGEDSDTTTTDDGSGTGGEETDDITSSDLPQDTSFATEVWTTDKDAYIDTATVSPDAGYDAGQDTAYYDAGVCPDWDINIQLNPSRIMVLQDISSSMREGGDPNKWEQAQSALISLMGSYGNNNWLHFGFDVFPDARDCHAEMPVVIDSAPYNGRNIFDLLGLVELSQSTPLFMAMGNFLDPNYAPVFSDKTYPSYLIIVSDGKDTCGNQPAHSPDEAFGANAAQLGYRARTLRDEHEIYTMAIGFGDAADPEQLNAIAQNGGTDFNQMIQAKDRNELEEVFARLAAYTINCEFTIDLTAELEGSALQLLWSKSSFFMNGQPLEKSPGCASASGWDWAGETNVSNKTATLVFCPDTCDDIMNSDETDISAQFECAPVIVPI